MRLWLLSLTACFGTLPLGPLVEHAAAQVKLLVYNQFEDSFENREVSGGIVVGLRRGLPDGPFDLHALEVDLPLNVGQNAKVLCVSIASRTSGYRALGEYLLAEVGPGLRRLQAKDANRATLLKSQIASNMAVLALLTSECFVDSTGTAVPIWLPGSKFTDILFVFVNAGSGRVQATLRDRANTTIASASSCDRVDGAQRVYSVICGIPLPADAERAAKLVVSMRSQISLRLTDYEMPLRLSR